MSESIEVLEPATTAPANTLSARSILWSLLALCPCTAPAVWLFNRWEKEQNTACAITNVCDTYLINVTVLDTNGDPVEDAQISVTIGSITHDFPGETSSDGEITLDLTSEVSSAGNTTISVTAAKTGMSFDSTVASLSAGLNEVTVHQA